MAPRFQRLGLSLLGVLWYAGLARLVSPLLGVSFLPTLNEEQVVAFLSLFFLLLISSSIPLKDVDPSRFGVPHFIGNVSRFSSSTCLFASSIQMCGKCGS
jgi:hypothetical protein